MEYFSQLAPRLMGWSMALGAMTPHPPLTTPHYPSPLTNRSELGIPSGFQLRPYEVVVQQEQQQIHEETAMGGRRSGGGKKQRDPPVRARRTSGPCAWWLPQTMEPSAIRRVISAKVSSISKTHSLHSLPLQPLVTLAHLPCPYIGPQVASHAAHCGGGSHRLLHRCDLPSGAK